jgi:hypothetical protein
MSGGDGAAFDYPDVGQAGAFCVASAAGCASRPPPTRCTGWDYYGGPACSDPVGYGGALRSQRVELRADNPAAPAVHNGAVLRLDPLTGGIPASNPAGRMELAWGLRQPFRLTR